MRGHGNINRRNTLTTFAGLITIAGAAGFIIITVLLHFLQPQYDPANQFMSELVFGPHGSLMLIAFSCFATSVFGAQWGFGLIGSPRTVRLLLFLAGVCLLGAGIFRLNTEPELHVGLIASAFVMLVLTMYVLPKRMRALPASSLRNVSWGLATGTTISVALGGTIPAGIAQRTAAACILLWLFYAGWQIITGKIIQDDFSEQ
jgi:hypothetical membrane protein